MYLCAISLCVCLSGASAHVFLCTHLCVRSGAASGVQEARDLVAAWGFMHSFGDMLGLWPASLAETLAALTAGTASRLTTELHVALLRLLQVRPCNYC